MSILREYIRELLREEETKGLWANVHAKRKRGEKPAKPGDKAYPDAKSWKAAQEEDAAEGESLDEAEYQGRKVTLNKPTKGDTKKSKVYVNSGKKNKDGTIKVKKVEFGDPDMKIKKSIPARKKSFRARHKCDQKKDKTTAGYWSCKAW